MRICMKQKEEGQGLVEYALVLVVVAVAIILILRVLGGSVVRGYAQAVGGINGGQALQKSGVEFIYLGGDVTVTQAGPSSCNVSISNATVFMAEGGVPSKNDTGNVVFKATGVQTQQAISTNNVGLASNVSATLNGATCPGTLEVGNTGHTAPIP